MEQKRDFEIDQDTLQEIRDNTDWQRLFEALGIRKDEKKSKPHDWWGWSPFTNEKTASFHLNDRGFYCFSTKESGGVVELVQKVVSARSGRVINCYEAGKWLLEHGVSYVSGRVRHQLQSPPPVPARVRRENPPLQRSEKINKPIRQNLLPLLSEQGAHPEFVKRGISEATCAYLGCGYLGKSRTKLRNRIVFQVRGVAEEGDHGLKPVVLSHIGRATTQEQEEKNGKWDLYKGFGKTRELYNIDQVLLNEHARAQAQASGHVLLVEGCFDVAKLAEPGDETGILNVVASFGSHLAEDQIPRLRLIAEQLGIQKFLVWYDRDPAGRAGQEKALALLKEAGLEGEGFDWEVRFPSPSRGEVVIPESIQDVCDFSVEQLAWLRGRGVV